MGRELVSSHPFLVARSKSLQTLIRNLQLFQKYELFLPPSLCYQTLVYDNGLAAWLRLQEPLVTPDDPRILGEQDFQLRGLRAAKGL